MIQWEDPPPQSSKQITQSRNAAILRELKANPGKWARVTTGGQSWLRWGCEVTRRGDAIWARWPE